MNTTTMRRLCDNSRLFGGVIKSNLEYMDETCWVRLCEQPSSGNLKLLENNIDKLGDECWITLCYCLAAKVKRGSGENTNFMKLFELIENNADLLPKYCFRILGKITDPVIRNRIYTLIEMFDE